MTLIVLAVLGAAWLGYFALWWRDRRASRPASFSSVGSTSVGSVPLAGASRSLDFGFASGGRREFLELPRTREQARMRRRQVATGIVAVAVVSLLAAPLLGSVALAIHVFADLALLLFLVGANQRRHAAEGGLAEVRVLHPHNPASAPAGAATADSSLDVPLRRAANG